MSNITLTGVLTAPSPSEPAYGGYLKFTADTAPAHLRIIWLELWACRSAKAGNRVEVQYRKTGYGYGYVVTQIFT
jgi:hypothetical protein